MTAAWDPQLRAQRDTAEIALATRCGTCGQRRKLPPMVFASAVDVVLQEFPVEREELFARHGEAIAVAARALLVWGLRTLGGPHGYKAIGRALGRDHAGIIHLHQKAIALRLRSPAFAAACERMAARYLAETETHHVA